jgi:glyoxylase-like metal-dependent hydrolase (beta-lactamase superfamily II)
MDDHFTPVTDDLLLFEDTCNVYVVRRGRQALLIDFGSGHVLEHLEEIGVDEVAAILHTHHHRDQAQGDHKAAAAGIPIHVPQHERHLFDQVETFWTTKQLYDVYNVRNTYFTLTKSVPVAGVLEDWSRFEWKGVSLEVVPTPGHTVGSISLRGRIDGAEVVFVGDLLFSPGKVQTLYDMQYSYGATDGVESAILSLNLLEDRGPAVLCPSHGGVMRDAAAAYAKTRDGLREFFRLQNGGALAADELDFTAVAGRLLAAVQACSYFYVILSRDGKRALFVDYGAPSFPLFQPASHRFEPGERVRFIHHSLSRLQKQYGVQDIEAVIPSHYHDDHINGIPYLQRAFGTEVWAYENMKEVLENPGGELLGCVLPDPIKVSRTFHDAERFSWEGIDFEAHFSPGHCDYHMSLFTVMDGKRIAFSGDNVWPPGYVPSLIYRNHVHRTSHQITARLFREYKPEVLCSGHGLSTNVAPEGYDLFLANTEKLTALFDKLLPEESGVLGIEPSWIQIFPYQMAGNPGETLRGHVRMKNPLPRPAKVEWEWALPDGWEARPAAGGAQLLENGDTKVPFEIVVPGSFGFPHPKLAIALDVVLEGKAMGQIAEAVVENRPYGAAGAPRPQIS